MTLAERAEQAARGDPRMVELLDELHEQWASLPAAADGAELVGMFMRAAYGRGYTVGLEERLA